MKRISAIILLLALTLSLAAGATAYQNLSVTKGFTVFVDGKQVNYTYPNGTKAEAVVTEDGVTLLPVRAIAEAIGKQVTVVGQNIYLGAVPTATVSTPTPAPTPAPAGKTYVLNTSTLKIHRPSCSEVSKIKNENYDTTSDFAWAINHGYEPCKRCNPVA